MKHSTKEETELYEIIHSKLEAAVEKCNALLVLELFLESKSELLTIRSWLEKVETIRDSASKLANNFTSRMSQEDRIRLNNTFTLAKDLSDSIAAQLKLEKDPSESSRRFSTLFREIYVYICDANDITEEIHPIKELESPTLSELQRIKDDLINFSEKNKKSIQHTSKTLEVDTKRRLAEISSAKDDAISLIETEQKNIKDYLETYKQAVKSQRKSAQEELSIKIESLEEHFKGYTINLENREKEIRSVIDSILQKYEESLQKREKEFSELTGKAANFAVVGEHLDAAKIEKRSADWMRGASLFCMFCIAALVSYSVWETWQEGFIFKWEEALQRMLNLFILTVPAAYLARESNKHRQQQYAYHQTALDLKALDPFIGTMPEEEQHVIKKEIANRIFASKDFSSFGQDNYPVNVHELLMAVLSKVETPKGNAASQGQQQESEDKTK